MKSWHGVTLLSLALVLSTTNLFKIQIKTMMYDNNDDGIW